MGTEYFGSCGRKGSNDCLKLIRITFSANPLAPVNPTHCTDVSKTLAWLFTPIFLPPFFRMLPQLKIDPGIFGGSGVPV
jgi:hypothetical protein